MKGCDILICKESFWLLAAHFGKAPVMELGPWPDPDRAIRVIIDRDRAPVRLIDSLLDEPIEPAFAVAMRCGPGLGHLHFLGLKEASQLDHVVSTAPVTAFGRYVVQPLQPRS